MDSATARAAGFDGGQLQLGSANFDERRGMLWLDEDELTWLRKRLEYEAKEHMLPLTLTVTVPIEPDAPPRQPSPKRSAAAWIASRSRSRSRSPQRGEGAAAAGGAAAATPRGDAPDVRTTDVRGLSGDDFEAQQLEVMEVETYCEKKAACQVHLSKNTFHDERNLVELRIFNGDQPRVHCRTWALVQRSKLRHLQGDAGAGAGRSAQASAGGRGGRGRGGRGRGGRDLGPAFLAAVTVRINSYERREGRWAQILNMSTKRERHGHGTMLIAGLEELLRREDVDVVVLYPAENGRAPAFWSSIGFGNRENSFLPEEELVPHDQVRPGTKDTPGPLLPEFDPGSHTPLPRWEKRIQPPLNFKKAAAKQDRTGGRRRPPDRQQEHRALSAASSRLEGAALQNAAKILYMKRAECKARWARDNQWGSSI